MARERRAKRLKNSFVSKSNFSRGVCSPLQCFFPPHFPSQNGGLGEYQFYGFIHSNVKILFPESTFERWFQWEKVQTEREI